MTPTALVQLPSLGDAITGVETAGASYQNAVTQTANDQATADAAQAKADAAKALVASDVSNEAAPTASYVGALQTLDTVVQAQIAALQPAPVSTGAGS